MVNNEHGMNCKTCNSVNAWENILSHGITTNECCPYISDSTIFPKCAKNEKCLMSHVPFEKFKADNAKTIKKNRHAAMIEIFSNGPIQSEMDVYEDFLLYEKGSIYSYQYGNYIGVVGVKVIFDTNLI